MVGKLFAGIAAALTFAMTATLAAAGGPMNFGGGAGAGAGMMGGSMGAMGMNRMMISTRSNRRDLDGSFTGVGSGMRGMLNFPFPTNDPNHYHEIRIVGRLAKDESGFTIDRQIVRMRVDGRDIPMSINGDATSDSLQFDQGDELGQNLYRLILSKRLGWKWLATTNCALRSRPRRRRTRRSRVVVDGFVYDRMTPYLVLVSVGDAP